MKDDLSPDARSLVEAGRGGDVLSRATRDRMKRGVLLRLSTMGAATAATGTAAGMSVAAKVTLTALAATVLGGGAFSVWEMRRPAATPPAVARPSTSPRDSAPNLPLPAAPHNETVAPAADSPSSDVMHREPAKKNGKRAASAVPAPSATSSAAAPLDPEPELKVLRQAREDLRAGMPESAYRRLVDYDRQHGQGVLAQERHAFSVIAFCKWRPGSEAQARAAEFLRSAPESPLAERVRSECESSPGAGR